MFALCPALCLPVCGQFSYTTDNDQLTITGYEGSDVNLSIPASIDGKAVAAIGDSALAGQTAITNIQIAAGIKHIGISAFDGCHGLSQIIVPEGVTNVGNGAFIECTNLVSVSLPGSVTQMGHSVFAYCGGLEQLELPPQLKEIGASSFFECIRLKTVLLPDELLRIEFSAFRNCSSLENIVIPSGVTSIANEAFRGCPRLGVVAFEGDAPALGGPLVFAASLNAAVYRLGGTTGWSDTLGGAPVQLVELPGFDLSFVGRAILVVDYFGSSSEVVLPPFVAGLRVSEIGELAFADTTYLSSVTVSESVSIIRDLAFSDCPSLDVVSFVGNEPELAGAEVFLNSGRATVYYRAETSGWGDDFGGRPAVEIKPEPLPAVLEPVIVNGFLVGVNILNSGRGYETAPNIRVVDTEGSGGSAVAVLDMGKVVEVMVTSAGAGYSVDTSLSVDAPVDEPRQAVATGQMVNGFLVGATLFDGGSGYLEAPSVELIGGGGTGAEVVATVVDGRVLEITVINAGIGYTSVPQFVIAPPQVQPKLSIRKIQGPGNVVSAELSLRLNIGRTYQLEMLTDWGNEWVGLNDPFVADSPDASVNVLTAGSRQFFRLIETR